MKLCKIDGCVKAVASRGWCHMHYARWRTHGDAEYKKPLVYCSIPNCGIQATARGWCNKHYERWKAHGDPLKIMIYTTPEVRFEAWTEWQGECLVWTGAINKYGYGVITINGVSSRAHRYAWERENDEIPEGMLVDHICHNRSCVYYKHLRLATYAENNTNRGVLSGNNTSGHRNVHWNSQTQKWQVELSKLGKKYYYGRFTNLEEAARVAENARKELFGEFAGKG